MHAFVELVPILDDNYVFMIRNHEDRSLIIVDPGDVDPCINYIKSNDLNLSAILITHHHPDHIGGIPALKKIYIGLPISAPEKNRTQITGATGYVNHGDQIQVGSFKFEVLELPGHTLGICGYFER